MLDLKLLEEKLDAALEKETNASLTEWLGSKRLQSYLNKVLSDSRTISKQKVSFEISTYFNDIIVNEEKKVVKSNMGYDLAA